MRQTTRDAIAADQPEPAFQALRTGRPHMVTTAPAVPSDRPPIYGIDRGFARLATASRQPHGPERLRGTRPLAIGIVVMLAVWTLASFRLASNDWAARRVPAPSGFMRP